MENIPPPIIAPPAEVPSPPEPTGRMQWAWWVLAIMVVAMIASQLMEYFDPAQKPSYAVERATLTQISKGIGDRTSADRIVSDLAWKKDKDIAASRIYVVAWFTAREKACPADLQGLIAKEKSGWDASLSKLYASDKISKEEALAYTKSIPEDEKLDAVIKKHIAAKSGQAPASAAPSLENMGPYLLVGVAMMAGAGGGVLIWVWYYQARATGKLAPLGFPKYPASNLEADTFALRTAFFIWLLGPLSPAQFLPKGFATFATLGASAALYFVPIAGFRLGRGFIGKISPLKAFGAAWTTYIAAMPILMFSLMLAVGLQKILPESSHPLTTELAEDPSKIWSAILAAVIMAPLMEETIFRGLLFPGIAKLNAKPIAAGLVSSAIFAMIHPQGIPAWPALAAVGAAAAFVTYQTRSLWPAIILHATHNGLLLLLALNIG